MADTRQNGSAPPTLLLGYCENLWSLRVDELREKCRQRNLKVGPSPGQAAPSKAEYMAALFLYEKAVPPDLWAEYRPFVAFMTKQPLHRMLEIASGHFGIPRLHTKALVCNAVIDALLDGSGIPQSLPGFFSRNHRPLVDVDTLQAQMRALGLHSSQQRRPTPERQTNKAPQPTSSAPRQQKTPDRKAEANKYAKLFDRIHTAYGDMDSLQR